MRVREVMSKKPEFLQPTATLKEAAAKMQELDCGFIPIGENDKLIGAVTDRDIVIRTLAEGKDPNKTTLRDVMSERIEFCFEDDDLNKAVKRMENSKVHRLVVLNKDKRMTGILALGDIARLSRDNALCAEALKGILRDEERKH
jgi:CBS domain-containing protein